MQVVAAAHSLAGMGGSETYLVTVADHLQRLGHDLWLFTPEPGRSSDVARRLGLRVAVEEGELPPDPDVLLVQDGVVACDLAARYSGTPQAFVAHSDVFDLQLPPQLPDLVAAIVVLYDRVERRIRALAEPAADIVRLSQPVDVERFKPARPLPARPLVAMALGNYVHGQRLDLLRRACERAGVELRHVGWHGEGERPAEHALNDADVVFGKARVIVEAMACGRAAYVFDHNGGDGWVTPESLRAARRRQLRRAERRRGRRRGPARRRSRALRTRYGRQPRSRRPAPLGGQARRRARRAPSPDCPGTARGRLRGAVA